MNIIKISGLMLGLALVTGCASTPKAQYISPNTYQSYDCTALTNEYNRLTQYLNTNKNPSALTMSGVGFGITGGRHGIYPTVSFGVGKANNSNSNNIGIAMGERDAVIQSGRMKQCSFVSSAKLSSEK